jgi:fatty acid desaturase
MTAAIKIPPLTPPRFLLAYSYWDILPVTIGVLHLVYQVALFILFPKLSWWVLIPMGLLHSYMVAWNIESVSHNFTHTPYFKSKLLNRIFALIESVAIGFSQQFYRTVHIRHHIGNSDLPKEGKTRDWFSIYRYGKDGKAENVWTYSLFGFFRGDSDTVFAEMAKNGRNDDVRWSKIEHAAFLGWFALGFFLNWKFMLYFLPFYYLGHVISMMVGYYEHYQANPELAIAWGVSTYGKWYNFFWMNNGYHAEHHYRPKLHWTQMKLLHEQIQSQQKENGVYVIKVPHYLGFLEKSL